MNLNEALRVLNAPKDVRCFLQETKCDAPPARLVEALNWLNAKTKYVNEELDRQEKHLKICIETVKQETRLLEQGSDLLKPKQVFANSIPIGQAREAASAFYIAGYASAVKQMYMVSEKEQQSIDLQSKAVQYLSEHIVNLRYTFSVDKAGMLKA